MSNSPEVSTAQGAEQLHGAREAAEARAEALRNKHERAGESGENTAEVLEKARAEANEALHGKEKGSAENKAGGEPGLVAIKRVTKKEKEKQFDKTLDTIQSQMSAPARAFSKALHNKFVENTSDAIGASVARPNAILAGSLGATILVIAVYALAKNYGYPLSGSETIVAFVAGWVLGIVYDYFKAMISGSSRA